MTITTVEDKSGLDALYKDSALTFQGITRDSIPDVIQWVKLYTEFKGPEENVYVVSGETMNQEYGLTGINRYAPHLNLVCVKLSDLKNPMNLVIPRFRVGGRWFDDIVDNSTRREVIEVEE